MTKQQNRPSNLDSQMLGAQCDWIPENLLASSPSLSTDSVHLWFCRLDLPKDKHSLALSLLNEHQEKKYQRRTKHQQGERYLAARYLLYQFISAYSGQAIEDIEIDYSRLDKPYLKFNPSKLQFNFSDTGGFGIFAFALNTEIGVDIEHLERQVNFEKVAAKRFTDSENKAIRTNAADSKVCPKRMLSAWTSKEAYGKALGLGINFEMNQVTTYHGEQSITYEKSRDVSIARFMAPENHIVSLAFKGSAAIKAANYHLKSVE